MAEFIGTFFLVFTVGCNVAAVGAGGSQGIFVAISIGSVLMITVYALGLSAAHIFSFRAIIFTVQANFRTFLPGIGTLQSLICLAAQTMLTRVLPDTFSQFQDV
jgi:glycerol uptake facilitator-like aquaporin